MTGSGPLGGKDRRRLLVSVSAAQLVSSVAAMAVAIRRGREFDVSFMRGDPDNVPRDSIWGGTALSAPLTMLVAQAAATTVLARRESLAAVRIVGAIGAIDVPGYLSERLVRRRLTPSGWDPVESPLIVIGMGLAAAALLLARKAAARLDYLSQLEDEIDRPIDDLNAEVAAAFEKQEETPHGPASTDGPSPRSG